MRISKTNERWFDAENDPDKSRVKIKHLSPEELDDINDQAFRQDIDYKKNKKGNLEPIFSNKYDSRLFRELPIQRSVIDWENFFDENNNLMECTHENVLMAIRQIEGFKEFISECREQFAKDIKQEKEAQLGNLQNSVSGPVK